MLIEAGSNVRPGDKVMFTRNGEPCEGVFLVKDVDFDEKTIILAETVPFTLHDGAVYEMWMAPYSSD